MQSINELLSDQLKVTPLGPGQKVEFRIKHFAVIDPSYSGPIKSGSVTLYGEDTIFDPFDKDMPMKTIYNITGVKKVGVGVEQKFDVKFDYIRFGSLGRIVCDMYKNNLYMFLKRSNRNRDNKFRVGDQSKAWKFFEVDPKKELKKEKALFDYRTMAQYKVLQTKSDSKILDLAQQFNELPVNRQKIRIIPTDIKSVRLSLERFSQSHPAMMMMASGEEALIARVLVDIAVEELWIVYNNNPEVRMWTWMRNVGEKGKKNIVKVGEGEDEVETLVQYLITPDGSEHLAELKARHLKYYSVQQR